MYIIKITVVGSRFKIVLKLMKNSHVTHDISAALVNFPSAHGQAPDPIHYDNAKYYLSKATTEASRSMGTLTGRTMP